MTTLDVTLVRSKLLVPSPAGLLHRPRLCERLTAGAERKLTVLSAPAGYGKTSALVDFARHTSIPVCWYTVDERDRDLGVFVRYLVGAIREQFPRFGQRTDRILASIGNELYRDPTLVVGDLANEALELDVPFVLILDNFEALDGAFGLGEFLRRLVDVLPDNCHVMIGSRVLPDVPVTRLVAKRQLVGVTVDDLRFDADEIRHLLSMSHIDVSCEEAEAISSSAEGWITGVLLLADHARGQAGSFLRSTQRATAEAYDYLAADVLEHQPLHIRHFLIHSAILREMSVRLLEQVLPDQPVGSLLSEVERRNLFVTRFGTGGSATYRYHHLFRSFLLQRAEVIGRVERTDIHLRAAAWFESAHDIPEAVHHYLATEAYDRAITLMERAAMERFTRGQVETLLVWFDALPEKIRDQAPWLAFYHSRVLTDRYDYAGARRSLSYAGKGFARLQHPGLLARVHNQRATLAMFESRFDDVLSEAQSALDLLDGGEPVERAEAQRLIGRGYIGLGRLNEGIDKLQSALEAFREVRSPYDIVNVLQDLTCAFTLQGAYDEATRCMVEALAVARQLGSPSQLAGVLNNLGGIHYLKGEYAEALPLYEEALAAARRGGNPRWEAYVLAGQAEIYRDLTAYGQAETQYGAAWRLLEDVDPASLMHVMLSQATMLRWQGHHAGVQRLLEEACAWAEHRGLSFDRDGLLRATRGIALAEKGDYESGIDLLSESIAFLESRHADQDLAQVRLLLAKAYYLAGKEQSAIAELRRVMRLARRLGSAQFVVIEGQHVPGLLQLGLDEGLQGLDVVIRRVAAMQDLRRRLLDAQTGDLDEPAVSRLEIFGFGESRVVRDGRVLSTSAWQAAAPRELFFYILTHGPVSRDQIGIDFWPDLEAVKMRNTFHATLYRIRRAVGTDAIVVENGLYRIGPVTYWFDVEEFVDVFERARLLPPHDWQAETLWRRATTLYTGDFLPDADRLWCVELRERYRDMFLDALIGLGRCCEVRRHYLEAVVYYRRALAVDSLREDVHKRVMECYVAADRRTDAISHFERCRDQFDKELGIEPAEELVAVYRELVGLPPL
ncbi:MAG: tetratricopeptide repeat protein [Chloroflexi bacterium]|nr:tetratricopeptide repeat protein [Chloroflexota bacterium]